ncbi:MAG TPA: ABC transporter ATP-binding protein, partial [Solirubrobacteraceae bacterium]
QAGSPKELYERPVNLFVAGFIGSPSMNFLPGDLEGDQVHLPIGDVTLPDDVRQKLGDVSGSRRVFAGLRPEDFEDAALVGGTSGARFKAKIDVLESMGSEFYAYFEVDSEAVSSQELEELAADAGTADLPTGGTGNQIVARLDAASRVRQGEEAEFWFDASKIHLFDPESGQSLLHGQAAPEPAGAGA